MAKRQKGQDTIVAKMAELYRIREAGERKTQPNHWVTEFRVGVGYASPEDAVTGGLAANILFDTLIDTSAIFEGLRPRL